MFLPPSPFLPSVCVFFCFCCFNLVLQIFVSALSLPAPFLCHFSLFVPSCPNYLSACSLSPPANCRPLLSLSFLCLFPWHFPFLSEGCVLTLNSNHPPFATAYSYFPSYYPSYPQASISCSLSLSVHVNILSSSTTFSVLLPTLTYACIFNYLSLYSRSSV